MIAPHNPTRKPKTQDGSGGGSDAEVERLFAWMMRFRRGRHSL
jgi:hypothetical protein